MMYRGLQHKTDSFQNQDETGLCGWGLHTQKTQQVLTRLAPEKRMLSARNKDMRCGCEANDDPDGSMDKSTDCATYWDE